MTDRDVRHFLTKVCLILNKHNVDYLVIGGAAVNYYGHNRVSALEQSNSKMKADLDFWYRPTIGNFGRLIRALAELDVDTSDLKELIFDPKRTSRLCRIFEKRIANLRWIRPVFGLIAK